MQKQESFYYQARAGAASLPTQQLRRGTPNSGLHCLYSVFLHEKFEKRKFLGWETSNWLPSVEGLGLIGFHFPGWPWVLIGSHFLGLIRISLAGHKS